MPLKLRPDEADILHDTALAWGWKNQFISPNSTWERFRIATPEMASQGLAVIAYNNGRKSYIKLTGDGAEELYDAFRKSLG